MMINGGIYRPSPVDEVLTPFISIWRTTGAGETLEFPFQSAVVYNCEVDWGDGTTDTITNSLNPEAIHTYAIAGDHTITITGLCPMVSVFFQASMRLKLIEIVNLGEVGWLSFANAFQGCENLHTVTIGTTDTSNVSDFHLMFGNCRGIIDGPDMSGVDVSNAFTINAIFNNCSGMTSPPNVSNWDVSTVADAGIMFNGCTLLVTAPDVSAWDTSSITNLGTAFGTNTNMNPAPDTTGWDTSQVTDMSAMYTWSPAMGTTVVDSMIHFNISNVTVMSTMFSNVVLPTADYDRLLVAFADQIATTGIIAGVRFDGGDSNYTAGGAGETARNTLTGAPHNWIITDLGSV